MCLCVRERESDLCALTLMRLRKSKYAPQLSELHGVNKKQSKCIYAPAAF